MHEIPLAEKTIARRDAAAWLMLALLACAVLLGMSVWFTAGAVAPRLAALWGLDVGQASALVTAVQLGFVAGTAVAAVLNLADVVPARSYFAASAALAALANAALLASPGLAAAVGTRFLTGFFLAGVYPPAMKMTATWFTARRGLAIGIVVGALTLGKALPFLLGALVSLDPRVVVLTSSAAALLGGLLVLASYRDGPYGFERRGFDWALVGTVLRERRTRLAILGYLGHMWELYAMWALVSVFFFDYFAARGASAIGAATSAAIVAFGVIGAGGIGSVLAGAWADRFGRERVTIWSMAVSGACAVVAGHLLGAAFWIVLPVCLIWGVAIVADSAQFSSLVTEVAPRHAVGTALTLQTSLGFLLTALTIWMAASLRAAFGWPVAFGALAVGPAFGIVAMARLRALRASQPH